MLIPKETETKQNKKRLFILTVLERSIIFHECLSDIDISYIYVMWYAEEKEKEDILNHKCTNIMIDTYKLEDTVTNGCHFQAEWFPIKVANNCHPCLRTKLYCEQRLVLNATAEFTLIYKQGSCFNHLK